MLRVTLNSGTQRAIFVITPGEIETRINNEHFRGKKYELAGNFSQWSSLRKFLEDLMIQHELSIHIRNNLQTGQGVYRATIDWREFVGWSTAAEKERFAPDMLESFEPNEQSTALRVRPTRTNIQAPLTCLATVVYQILPSLIRVAGENARILAVYPGMDVGPLDGDITTRCGAVFFHEDHPGEPLEISTKGLTQTQKA
jgi:hypothetical protein